ncbi:MAG: ferrous iron transport protein A [Firmicutes bacterium]|nr:ferrous iron transport protein A [Bacillota bacterium]
MRLSDTAADSFSAVKKINGDAHFMKRITSIGITEGSSLQTVKNDPKMPLLIYSRETLIALNRSDAEKVEVAAL